MLSLVPDLLVNIAHIGKVNEAGLTVSTHGMMKINNGHRLSRHAHFGLKSDITPLPKSALDACLEMKQTANRGRLTSERPGLFSSMIPALAIMFQLRASPFRTVAIGLTLSDCLHLAALISERASPRGFSIGLRTGGLWRTARPFRLRRRRSHRDCVGSRAAYRLDFHWR
jgi:hypothetical protein